MIAIDLEAEGQYTVMESIVNSSLDTQFSKGKHTFIIYIYNMQYVLTTQPEEYIYDTDAYKVLSGIKGGDGF